MKQKGQSALLVMVDNTCGTAVSFEDAPYPPSGRWGCRSLFRSEDRRLVRREGDVWEAGGHILRLRAAYTDACNG